MPETSLSRRIRFSAGHRYHVPELDAAENARLFGKCNLPHGHGHNYAVDVTVGGPVDPVTGMIVDLGELDAVLTEEVVEPFDHRFLNEEIPAFATAVPTTENLAREIWRRLRPRLERDGRRLLRVRVYEDETLWADCAPADPVPDNGKV